MSADVVRVRGDAPEIVWPANALAPHIARCDELRLSLPPYPHTVADSEKAAATQLFAQWEAEFIDAQRESIAAFAAAQGWQRSERIFPPKHLLHAKNRRGKDSPRPWYCTDQCFEHPDWLTYRGRMAGVVVHLYPTRTDIDLDKLPGEIVVDQLPDSWYFPRWTNAFLLRPSPLI
jgi:hypothetical protein